VNAPEVLRGRLRLARSSFRGSTSGRRHSGWRDLTVAGAFAFVSTAALAGLFDRMALTHVPVADAAAVLGLALTAAFIGLAVFDLQQAVSTLVLDSDLTLLRVAPIGPRALAALKLFDAMPPTGLLTLVLVAPAIIAFARAYPLPAWVWLPMPIAVLALWMMPLATGMSVAMPLLRRVPARLARETLAVFATGALVLLWVAQAFVLPRAIEHSGDFAAPLVALARAWSTMGVWLPPFWLARVMGDAAAGATAARATAPLLALLTVAAGTLALYLTVARHQLERALEPFGHAAGTTRTGSADTRIEPARGIVRAVIRRDALLIRREWSVLVDVVVACVLWVMVPLAAMPLSAGLAPLAGPMLTSLAVGLGYEVGGRSVPFERRSLAWIALAPIPPTRWLIAKMTGAALFSVPILLVAAVSIGIGLRPPPALFGASLLITLSALVASLSLGVWTGIRYGDPEWVNPRGMLVLRGRLLSGFALIVQVGFWIGLLWLASPPEGPVRPLLLPVAPVAGLIAAWLGVALSRDELRHFVAPA
jgi:hypothetical protein